VADVRVFVGSEEFDPRAELAERQAQTMRRVVDDVAAFLQEEARRPTVRLRRAWRALRGR
jgi:hypothetical protein